MHRVRSPLFLATLLGALACASSPTPSPDPEEPLPDPIFRSSTTNYWAGTTFRLTATALTAYPSSTTILARCNDLTLASTRVNDSTLELTLPPTLSGSPVLRITLGDRTLTLGAITVIGIDNQRLVPVLPAGELLPMEVDGALKLIGMFTAAGAPFSSRRYGILDLIAGTVEYLPAPAPANSSWLTSPGYSNEANRFILDARAGSTANAVDADLWSVVPTPSFVRTITLNMTGPVARLHLLIPPTSLRWNGGTQILRWEPQGSEEVINIESNGSFVAAPFPEVVAGNFRRLLPRSSSDAGSQGLPVYTYFAPQSAVPALHLAGRSFSGVSFSPTGSTITAVTSDAPGMAAPLTLRRYDINSLNVTLAVPLESVVPVGVTLKAGSPVLTASPRSRLALAVVTGSGNTVELLVLQASTRVGRITLPTTGDPQQGMLLSNRAGTVFYLAPSSSGLEILRVVTPP